MNEIKEWLEQYGLNKTEISVYISVLEHPECKTSDIQRRTGLVRTTIYNALAELKNDGLLSENMQNNVKTYRPTDTDNLEHNIEARIHQQQRKLNSLIELKPLFEKFGRSRKSNESYVARFEGINPVKQALEAAFRCQSKRWHIIASRDNFLYHTSTQYKKYYLAERKRRGIIAKTLWEPTDSFRSPSLEDVFYRNPRRLPKEFLGAFTSLIILYDDTTLVIDPYDQKTAHAVHNPASTQLMRLMFESIWKNAKQG